MNYDSKDAKDSSRSQGISAKPFKAAKMAENQQDPPSRAKRRL